ncbi:class I SAM-dependent methyltransferase [Desulfobacter sp.]|uniref:class I SAM-dependent methyltransferase n=1 Tax=Desulfobacter sp. TaxID=2294 RepID=UPI003D09F25A
MTEDKTKVYTDQQIKQVLYKLYDLINRQIESSEYGDYATFLNWGYVSGDTPSHSVVQLPKIYLNKSSTQLILELVGDTPMDNRHVLDVGCGRGGALSCIDTFFNAKSLTGIDLNSENISFCKKKFKNISFQEGNAESLPFQDHTSDIVMNIESSSNYLNIGSFFLEVSRVLKPDGVFLYTDIFNLQDLDDYFPFLKKAGFKLEVNRDITSNVLIARDEASAGFVMGMDGFKGIDKLSVEECCKMIDLYSAHKGTRSYKLLQSGQFVYRMFRFRKVGNPAENIHLRISNHSKNRVSNFCSELLGQEIMEKMID